MIEKETKFVDIYPLKKSHRILAWLGDFFINLICTVLLFNIVVFPITKAIVNYDSIKTNMANCQDDMIKVLYENKVLFYEENELNYFEDNLVTTKDYFVRYHVNYLDDSINCFYNYYTSIQDKPTELIKLYSSGAGSTFFNLDTLDTNGVPNLKAEYKEEFAPLYIHGDALSEKAKSDYDSFSSLFLKYYNVMLEDIKTNDLTYDNMSYINLNNRVDNYVTQLDNYTIVASIISYLLSTIIFYIIIPLFSIKEQTITEKVMKINKVGQNNLRLLPKSEVVLQAFYSLFSNLTLIIISVVPTVDIAYAFSLNLLVFLSAFGLLYDLISLFFILFNQYNKSLTDMLTRVIILEDEDLRKVVKTKGNKF